MITLDESVCHDLPVALQREWLETNGLGGFAFSTILGCNTRRYHGLLVAAQRPPVGRVVLLSHFEERLRHGGEPVHLSTNLYDTTVHPEGYRHLREFRLDPWPVMTFATGVFELEKSVFMPHGRSATVISYTLRAAPEPTWLLLRPLFACRDYMHLARARGDFDTTLDRTADQFSLRLWGGPDRVFLHHPGGEMWPDGMWYYSFRYPREEEMGLDSGEDLYSPGEVRYLLAPGETVSLVATTEPDLAGTPADWAEQERARRRQVAARAPAADEVGRQLALAADQFVVRRRVGDRNLLSLIAGYPWFTDWGRDAMIATCGLLALPDWRPEAAQVLQAWATFLRGGLLPNTFDDTGHGAHYNTVDASLWFLAAVRQFAGDAPESAADLYAPVREVLRAYSEGTQFGIHTDAEGLLQAGSPETQLTWMDAKMGDVVFTPRPGAAVEINALWYSGLRTGQFLAERLDPVRAPEYCAQAEQVAASFRRRFWNEERGYLYDCLGPAGPDPALRPNQLLALSLPDPLLSREQGAQILAAVTEHLLTPYGLRTLAPFEPGYLGRCIGSQWERDSAYHQGTVWPWLLGPYLQAYFWVNGVSEETRRHARGLLQPLVDHLGQAGLGTISEIFDGDEPHAPRGCLAQAWSVAQVLRCWVEFQLGEV
ncbi:MAG TPA: amylo-alpha-1,6-glucosidase [Armatimonadota bacterium]|jgi:predicted glycogen debranching enzyme